MKQYEPGCYGDGTLGHQHTREKCSEVLQGFVEYRTRTLGKTAQPSYMVRRWSEIVRALEDEMSDDAQEEYDACELINEIWELNFQPEPTCYWGWQDGDFGLWQDEEEE